MSVHVDTVEECVERTIGAVGPKLVLGAPLGLGKPIQLINAFYRRVASDPELSLHIYTALSLEKPVPGSHIEEGLAGPILKRLFGDFEDLDFMKAIRAGGLPGNIEVSELYFKAGSMKSVPMAQQNYVSSNYTHIVRDMRALGVNVWVQMVAFREAEQGMTLSLSSNSDITLEIVEKAAQQPDRPLVTIAQLHPDMPYMEHDAEVEEDFFQLVVRNPTYDKTLFAVPNAAVPLQDYAAGIHASSLIADGGTLQIGIGSLGDAIARATSAPRPVAARTGTNAISVVNVVIRHGRMRRRPASTVALRMSSIVVSRRRVKT